MSKLKQDSRKKTPTENTEKKYEELKIQNEEYLAGWQRCKADFENYKKRQEEWAENFRKYAHEDLVAQIIPLIDNLILALSHIPDTEENKNWRLGLDQIVKQGENILINNKVEIIEVKKGEEFNPEEQECLNENNDNSAPSSPNQKNKLTVSKVLKRGYRMGGKIIQPALVVLG